MENNTSVKEANAEVITAKTVVAIIDLAARLKQRSLWNCEIRFAIKQQKVRQAMISTSANNFSFKNIRVDSRDLFLKGEGLPGVHL